MEVGMVGLGRMGLNMSKRLMRGGHLVLGYDQDQATLNKAREQGIKVADSLESLSASLTAPRVTWLMIPAGPPIEQTLQSLLPLLSPGDIVVDGGNSYYKDSIRRAQKLKEHRIHFVDVGTSGGIWGLQEGYCLMIGGEKEVIEYLRPLFETLAPSQDKGWAHMGPNGAGHFVKMIHNGIEYGLQQAYAEGFALLRRKKEFQLDLHQIAETWRYGSVIRSWLLDLIAQIMAENPALEEIEPYVEDSGEGRWTVFEAIDLEISAPGITLSLLQRLRSRDRESYADRLSAVLREKFGGHKVLRRGEKGEE